MRELRPCYRTQIERDESPWGRFWGVTAYPVVEDCGHPECHRLNELVGEQRNLAKSHFSHIKCNCEREFARLHWEIEQARGRIKSVPAWEEDKRIIALDKKC